MVGLTSVTFRKKSIDEVIRIACKAKLDCIEWGGDIHVPPGKIKLAARVHEKTLAAGLNVSSYASYYRLLENKEPASAFLPVLETASALCAPIIRVWAGIFSPKNATEGDYIQAANELRTICDMARKKSIVIALEYHENTLTENSQSALKLLNMAKRKNLSTYWQSKPCISTEENAEELEDILPFLSNIHVFFRGNNREYFPLRTRGQYWRGCVNISYEKAGAYLLEFVKDDNEELLLDDASFLRSIVPKKNAVFITQNGYDAIHSAFDEKTVENLRKHLVFKEPLFSREDFIKRGYLYKNISYIFSTLGMLALTKEEISNNFPRLKAVFCAAESVQDFARPFLESGVRVYSAEYINAVFAAEFAVSQIISVNKGFFAAEEKHFTADSSCESRACALDMPENRGCKVGIIGVGTIGRLVIERLHESGLEIFVFDPLLTDKKAEKLNIKKTVLPMLFCECQIILNHLADNKDTRGILNYALFSLMKKDSCFINIGSEAQIVKKDLARALREEPERRAVFDVNLSGLPRDGCQLYSMDNVTLTSCIAKRNGGGNINAQMGECMLKAYVCETLNAISPFRVRKKMLQITDGC